MDLTEVTTSSSWVTRATTHLAADSGNGIACSSLSRAVGSPPALKWSTMSAIERSNPADGAVLDELPQFELTYRYDDDDAPNEVTVFEDVSTEDRTTRWITVDYPHAVALESVR